MELVIRATLVVSYPPGIILYEDDNYEDLTEKILEDTMALRQGDLDLYDVLESGVDSVSYEFEIKE